MGSDTARSKGERGRWLGFATAPDQLTAEMWRDLLVAGGVPAMLDPRDTSSYLGLRAAPVRVLVREGDVGEAGAILGDLLDFGAQRDTEL